MSQSPFKLAVTVVLLVLAATPAVAADGYENPAALHQLGFSFGVPIRPSELNAYQGTPVDAALYMKHNLSNRFGFHLALGWADLGEINESDLGLRIFNQYFLSQQLNLKYWSIGPFVQFETTHRQAFLIAPMLGFYDVAMNFESGLGSSRAISNKQFGLHGKLAYSVSLGSVVSMRAQFDLHWLNTDANASDIYYVSTGTTDPGITSLSVGIQVKYR